FCCGSRSRSKVRINFSPSNWRFRALLGGVELFICLPGPERRGGRILLTMTWQKTPGQPGFFDHRSAKATPTLFRRSALSLPSPSPAAQPFEGGHDVDGEREQHRAEDDATSVTVALVVGVGETMPAHGGRLPRHPSSSRGVDRALDLRAHVRT